jgi:hypothetical protein
MSHAIAAFQIMGRNESIVLVERIVNTITQNEMRQFSRRDLHQHVRRHVKTPDDLDPPLALLEEHNFIREVEPKQSPKTSKKRPSPLFEANPILFDSGASQLLKPVHSVHAVHSGRVINGHPTKSKG